jgi:hypothetical protein
MLTERAEAMPIVESDALANVVERSKWDVVR